MRLPETVWKAPSYILLGSCLSLAIHANPQAPSVVHGEAQFQGLGSANVQVQNSNGAIINWQQFNIGANESTHFAQSGADSKVLNRVTGLGGSEILGRLSSNGQVYLVNQNGLIFGQNAMIDTAGFLASTLDISNSNFINGHFDFSDLENAAEILNQGFIHTSGSGEIVLIAPSVSNEGVLETEGGDITLAAGHSVKLSSFNAPEISFEITAAESKALNVGQMLTHGGSAQIFAHSIEHSGAINANSISTDAEGNIVLGAVAETTVSGRIENTSANGQGGSVRILAENIRIEAGALIDASGSSGGGEILIGGDYQGANAELPNAQTTQIAADTVIRADATQNGDGGKVIVWADQATHFAGQISATAGAEGGDGGFVETSGKEYLQATGAVNASAPQGKAGEWLLDPRNVSLEVVNNDGVDDSSNGSFDSGTPNAFTPSADDAVVDIDQIEASLAGGTNVTISTVDAGGTQAGNITVTDAIAADLSSGDVSLTLNAENDINLYNDITASSSALDLILIADSDGANLDGSGGKIKLGNEVNIDLNGGDITATAGSGYMTVLNDGDGDGVFATLGFNQFDLNTLYMSGNSAGSKFTISTNGTLNVHEDMYMYLADIVGSSSTINILKAFTFRSSALWEFNDDQAAYDSTLYVAPGAIVTLNDHNNISYIRNASTHWNWTNEGRINYEPGSSELDFQLYSSTFTNNGDFYNNLTGTFLGEATILGGGSDQATFINNGNFLVTSTIGGNMAGSVNFINAAGGLVSIGTNSRFTNNAAGGDTTTNPDIGNYLIGDGGTLNIGGANDRRITGNITDIGDGNVVISLGAGGLIELDGTLDISGSFSVTNSDASGVTDLTETTITDIGPSVSLNNGNLNVLNLSTTDFTLNGGGTLNVANSMTVTGLFSFDNATLAGSGSFNTSGTTSLSSTQPSTLASGMTWNNSGSVNWIGNSAADDFVLNGSFNNQANGVFNIKVVNSSQDIRGSGVFNNLDDVTTPGVVNLDLPAGVAHAVINTDFNNGGVVNLNSGTLYIDSDGSDTGDYNVGVNTWLYFRPNEGENFIFDQVRSFSSSASIQGAGNVSFDLWPYSKIDFDGTYNVSGSTLIRSFDDSAGDAQVDFSAANSVTMAGTLQQSYHVGSDSQLLDTLLPGVANLDLSGLDLINLQVGTLTLPDGVDLSALTTISLNGAIGSAALDLGNATLGTLDYINLLAGTLTLPSFTVTDFNLSGGTLLMEGNSSVTNDFTFSSATLSGAATLTSQGTTTLAAVSDANIASGTTWNNSGVVTWTGNSGDNFNINGTFNNLSGGVFNIQTTNSNQVVEGLGTFNNLAGGIVNAGIAGGADYTSFYLPINNAGTINVDEGRLYFNDVSANSGLFDIDPNAALWFTPNDLADLALQTTTFSSTSTVQGAGDLIFLLDDNAAIDFDGTLNLSGLFNIYTRDSDGGVHNADLSGATISSLGTDLTIARLANGNTNLTVSLPSDPLKLDVSGLQSITHSVGSLSFADGLNFAALDSISKNISGSLDMGNSNLPTLSAVTVTGSSLVIGGSVTITDLAISGGSLTLQNTSVINNASDDPIITGGVLSVNGNTTVSNGMQWSVGTISGSGQLNLPNLTTSNWGVGGGDMYLDGITLVNNGTINYTENDFSSHELIINNGAILENRGDFVQDGNHAQIYDSSLEGYFKNYGTFTVLNQGAGHSLNFSAEAGSTIDVAAGQSLLFGQLDFVGNSTISGDGEVLLGDLLSRNSHSIADGVALTGGFKLVAGTLTLSGNSSLSSGLDWNGGTIAANSDAATDSLTLGNSAVSEWGVGGGDMYLDDVTLINLGSINYTENDGSGQEIIINNGAVLENRGVFNQDGIYSQLYDSSQSGYFKNFGVFNVLDDGEGHSLVFSAEAGSTLDIAANQSLLMGQLDFVGNNTISGDGEVRLGDLLSRNNSSIAAGVAITGGLKLVSGGVLNVSGGSSISGFFNWNGGTLNGLTDAATDSLTLAASAISSWGLNGGNMVLNNVSLINNGIINYEENSDQQLYLNNASKLVNNQTFNWTGIFNEILSNSGASGVFDNFASFNVDVQSSQHISIDFNANSGSIVDVDETFDIIFGQLNILGDATFTGLGIAYAGNWYNGSHSWADGSSISGSSLYWGRGTFSGISSGAELTVKAGAELTLGDLSGNMFLSDAVLNNLGTIHYLENEDQQLYLDNAAQIVNNGVFNWGGSFNEILTSAGTAGSFENNATFNVDAQSSQHISIDFNANTGSIVDVDETFHIVFGQLNILGDATFNGLGIAYAGNWYNSSHSWADGSSISGSSLHWGRGTFSGIGSGAELTVKAGAELTLADLSGNMFLSDAVLNNLGTIHYIETEDQQLYLNNAAQIVNNGVFNWAGSFNEILTSSGTAGSFENNATFNVDAQSSNFISIDFNANTGSIVDVDETLTMHFGQLNILGDTTFSGLGKAYAGSWYNESHSWADGSSVSGNSLHWGRGSFSGIGSGAELTINAGATLTLGELSGHLTQSDAVITNLGTLIYAENVNGNNWYLEGNSVVNNNGTFNWNGQFGYVLTTTNGTFNNTGTLIKSGVGVNRLLTPTNFNNVAGTIDIQEGSIGFSGSSLTLDSGSVLSGSGTLNNNLINAAGSVAPGSSAEAIAQLTINGSYIQQTGGKLVIDVAGNSTPGVDFDSLLATGAMTLDGNLTIAPVSGYTPANNTVFDGFLKSASSLSGVFTTVTGLGFDFPTYDYASDFDAQIEFISTQYVFFDNENLDYLWGNPLNWSTDTLPTSVSDVYINQTGQVIVVTGGLDYEVNSLSMINGDLSIATGSLTVGADLTLAGNLSNAASLTLSGANNSVGGSLSNSGTLTLLSSGSAGVALEVASSSDIGGLVVLDNSAGGVAQLSSAVAQSLSGSLQSLGSGSANVLDIANLSVSGTLNIDHDLLVDNSSRVLLLSDGAQVDIASGQSLDVDSGAIHWDGGTLQGAGSLLRSNGATLDIGQSSDGGSLVLDGLSVSLIDPHLENSTRLSVLSGSLEVFGSLLIDSGAELQLSGGSINLNLGGLSSTRDISLSNGRLVADGGAINGIGGNGQINIAALAGSSMTINSGSAVNLSDMDINNQQQLLLNNGSSLVFNNDATLNNSGTLLIQGDVSLSQSGPGPFQILNSGTLNKATGQGSSVIALPLNNSGSLVLSAGTLNLSAGLISSGSLNTATSTTLLVSSTQLSGGSLQINGSYTNSGAFNWNAAASINGNGSGSLTLQGATSVSGAGTHDLISLNLIHSGTLTLNNSNGDLRLDGVSFANSGIINFNGDGNLASSGAVSSLTNSGTLQKTGGSGSSLIGSQINIDNAASVVVSSGTLSLAGSFVQSAASASTVVNSGSTLSNSNSLQINAGALEIASAATLDGSVVNAASMNLLGSVSGDVNNLSLLTASGAIGGTLTNANNATLFLLGTVGNLVNNGQLHIGQAAGQVGSVTVSGNFTQGATGRIDLDIGSDALDENFNSQQGIGYDAITVAGNASFGGHLQVGFINNYATTEANTYVLLEASQVALDFDTATTPSELGAYQFGSAQNSSVLNQLIISFIEGGLVVFNPVANSVVLNDPANWTGSLEADAITGIYPNLRITLNGSTELILSDAFGPLIVNSISTTEPLVLSSGAELLVVEDATFNNSVSLQSGAAAQFGGTTSFNELLTLSGATISGYTDADNQLHNGILVLGAGLTVDTASTLQGVLLSNTPGQTLQLNADLALQQSAYINNAGSLVLSGNSNLLSDATGSLLNTGSLIRNGAADLLIEADLVNTGRLDFQAANTHLGGNFTQSGGSLAGSAEVTVDGFSIWTAGQLLAGGNYNSNGGVAITGPMLLDRTLVSNGVGLLSGNGAISGSGALLNNGNFSINNGTLIAVDVSNNGDLYKAFNSGETTINGAFVNSGDVFIDGHADTAAQTVMSFGSSFVQSAGRFINNGVINVATMVINGGFVGGNSVINGDVLLNGGELAPGNSVGLITINGDLTLGNNAILTMEASAADVYDIIEVSGLTTLAGTLNVTFIDGYQGNVNDSYQYIQAANSNTGGFDIVNGFDLINPPLGYDFDNSVSSGSQTFSLTGSNFNVPTLGASSTPETVVVYSSDIQAADAVLAETSVANVLIEDVHELLAAVIDPTQAANDEEEDDERNKRLGVCR